MTNNFDAENAKKIIYDDNVNITEASPLKDLVQIALNITLIIISIYLFVFITSGIILQTLSSEKQIAMENFISHFVNLTDIAELSETEKQRLYNIRNRILEIDPKFPKTSNLDINVINEPQLNAFCYPNGNIYITSALYQELKSDEELTFIIAHEMAHYKHKDHLLSLRRSLSNGVILIIISFVNPNSKEIGTLVNGGLNVTDLKFSRGAEEKADKYAIKIMNILYGNAKAGVDVMQTLKSKNSFDIEFLSTHPNLDKRIKYIQKFSH